MKRSVRRRLTKLPLRQQRLELVIQARTRRRKAHCRCIGRLGLTIVDIGVRTKIPPFWHDSIEHCEKSIGQDRQRRTANEQDLHTTALLMSLKSANGSSIIGTLWLCVDALLDSRSAQ